VEGVEGMRLYRYIEVKRGRRGENENWCGNKINEDNNSGLLLRGWKKR
jgi:hypothetical protein